MSRRNQHELSSSKPSATRLAQAALVAVCMAGSAWGIITLKKTHDVETLDPKFAFVDFKDASLSFSAEQLKAEFGVHDQVYESCFGGEPVQYVCYTFGGNVVEAGSAVTASADETWPILDRVAPVDANASRFAPAIRRVMEIAKSRQDRVVGVLFQSDAEATDWEDLDKAAKDLSKFDNVGFVAITGAIPTSRIRMRKAMEPLGDRFVACDQADMNAATRAKLSALVERARRNR